MDDHRVLLAVVLGVGEEERQQPLLAELLERPEERLDAGGSGPDWGWRRRVARARRGDDADAGERARGQAEAAVAVSLGVVEPGVGVVEEQQVLALDVEDQRLGVGLGGAEHARVEQRVEQEGGVGGLGGHAGDARDVDVGAPGAVEELHVEEERLAVARQPGRDLLGHVVEVEGAAALVAGGLAHVGAGQRRHEDLGLEPGGHDLGRPDDLGRAGRRRR